MVTVKIYNSIGQIVETLVNENQSAGTHSVKFNGAKLSSGVYLCRLNFGQFSSVKKMVLMK
jgi:flagellar hook assembly protein FlgD